MTKNNVNDMKFAANKEFMENLSLHCLRASTIFSHLVLFIHDYNTQFAQNRRPHIKSRTTFKKIKNILPMHTLLELSRFKRRSFQVPNLTPNSI